MDNMIDIDITILIQLVNFLITIVALNFLLIKPVREQIQKRNALTADYAAEIERFSADAESRLGNYEKSLAAARAEANAAREALKQEAQASEQGLLKRAQADAQAFMQKTREQVAAEAKAASSALLSQVDGFAAQAATKILG